MGGCFTLRAWAVISGEHPLPLAMGASWVGGPGA